ncbi:MAG: hypothetical protein KDD63_01640 [Bacteroidetes bacterium]|nr:hypothetical protein [Bacteroidota bacterium]
MVKQFRISHWLLALVAACMIQAATGQIITNQTAFTIQSGCFLIVQGDLVNEGSGEFLLAGQIFLKGNILNQSSTNLTSGTGEVALLGPNQLTIGGTNLSRFDDLSILSSNGLKLEQNIQVEGELNMLAGGLDLNGQNIDLLSTGTVINEANANRIFGSSGKIITTRNLGIPNGSNIAGLGVYITSDSDLGMTTIERGHDILTMGSATSIARHFQINPANNSGLAATLKIDYFNSELNGQNPDSLNQWRFKPGSIFWQIGNVPNKGTPNYLEGGPYNSMGLWTLSDGGSKINSIDDLLPRLTVNYYPNPLLYGEKLRIAGLQTGEYFLILFDMRGRSVWETSSRIIESAQVEEYEFPLLPEGIYSLRISSEKYAPSICRIQIQSN